MSNRRQFLKNIPIVAVAGVVISMSDLVLAAPMVAETGPQAKALGYVTDMTKAGKAKLPKYTPDQYCGNCVPYQGGTAAQGGYPLFAGKDVANKGRCSARTKRARAKQPRPMKNGPYGVCYS